MHTFLDLHRLRRSLKLRVQVKERLDLCRIPAVPALRRVTAQRQLDADLAQRPLLFPQAERQFDDRRSVVAGTRVSRQPVRFFRFCEGMSSSSCPLNKDRRGGSLLQMENRAVGAYNPRIRRAVTSDPINNLGKLLEVRPL